jgi:hypothetical protein
VQICVQYWFVEQIQQRFTVALGVTNGTVHIKTLMKKTTALSCRKSRINNGSEYKNEHLKMY